MTPEQTGIVERLRLLLAQERVLREVSMFGGRAFMVDERMVVSALKDGGVLVRVDPARHDELVTRPGASQAQMGPARDMGPGWVEVAADALARDPALSSWVEIALAHNRALTSSRL